MTPVERARIRENVAKARAKLAGAEPLAPMAATRGELRMFCDMVDLLADISERLATFLARDGRVHDEPVIREAVD